MTHNIDESVQNSTFYEIINIGFVLKRIPLAPKEKPWIAFQWIVSRD
jgi:hypothetical protein